MSPAAEILVIILSVFLAIFLALGIALFVYLIKLTRDISKITQAAGRVAERFDSMVSNLAKLTPPIFIVDLITKYVNKFKKNKKSNKGD